MTLPVQEQIKKACERWDASTMAFMSDPNEEDAMYAFLDSIITSAFKAGASHAAEKVVEYIDKHVSRSEKETEGMHLEAWNAILQAAKTI